MINEKNILEKHGRNSLNLKTTIKCCDVIKMPLKSFINYSELNFAAFLESLTFYLCSVQLSLTRNT